MRVLVRRRKAGSGRCERWRRLETFAPLGRHEFRKDHNVEEVRLFEKTGGL